MLMLILQTNNDDGGIDLAGLLILGAIVLALYMLPTIIASSRNHRQFVPLGIINFFFGWTFLGWVGCLAWAFQAVNDSQARRPQTEVFQNASKPTKVTTPLATSEISTKVFVRDFLSLTPSEAALICEVVGGLYMSGDSRLTVTERLVQALDDDWENAPFAMDFSEQHPVADLPALLDKVRPLTARQTRSVIAAANRVWKRMEREDELDELKLMRDEGLSA